MSARHSKWQFVKKLKGCIAGSHSTVMPDASRLRSTWLAGRQQEPLWMFEDC